MKILILLSFFTILASQLHAVTRPNIDTVSMLGLNPGLHGKMVGSRINCKLDTLLWDDNSGIGITKFTGIYLGRKGEFRIAYDKGYVTQVSFVAPTNKQGETEKVYSQLTQEIIRFYGTPDIETKVGTHEMRWEGIKQFVSIKAIDEMQYVTIALSRFDQN